MFDNDYIPVNVNRNNSAVYSNSEVYPVAIMTKVYNALTSENSSDVIVTDGVISIVSMPEIKWQLTSFYLAYNAYKVALKNNFSFYAVMNEHGVPALFVSKQFKGNRILCNAYTMKCVLISGKNYVSRIGTMIDHTYSNSYCMHLFEVFAGVCSGSTRYLKAVLINKDTDNECMMVSPVLTMHSEDCGGYYAECIKEFEDLVAGATETDTFKFENGAICGKGDYECLPSFSMQHAKSMIELYDKLKEKNVSYIPIYTESSDTSYIAYYLSTDGNTLVHAETFECIRLRNSHTKQLFAMYASKQVCTLNELQLGWMLAKTE